MCGRAAQTSEAVLMAAESLLLHITNNNNHSNKDINNERDNNCPVTTTNLKKCIEQMQKATSSSSSSTVNTGTTTIEGTVDDTTTSSKVIPSTYNESNATTTTIDHNDPLLICNYNMSPGMEAIIFWCDHHTKEITMGKKVWGLIPRNGTISNPIPNGMNKHFEGLMFNARSDTLYEKQTFAKLVKSPGKTCIIALNGYFEWKSEIKGRKQPYYVYHNNNKEVGTTSPDLSSYLLIAGLWTSVSTGNKDNPTLDTFCMITTEVCTSLKWLHSRMPVIVHDISLAYQWLLYPSEHIHEMLYQSSSQYVPNDYLNWHAVTPDMTSMKFRTINAIQPLPKMKTVKSFFTPATPNTTTSSSSPSINHQNKLSSASSIMNKPKFNSTTNSDDDVASSSLLSRKRSAVDNSIITTIQSPSSLLSSSSPMKKQNIITSPPSKKSPSSSSIPNKKKEKPKTTGTLLSFFQPKK